MGFNKKRLYVAFYPSGVVNNEERRYHWAFLVGPKDESPDSDPGKCCHVRNLAIGGWTYEEVDIRNVKVTTTLLARLVIAKIENERELLRVLRETPVVQDDPEFRCRTWMADALVRMANTKPCVVDTSQLDWEKVERKARRYVENKHAAGRYEDVDVVMEPKPTWNLMEQKEVVE